MSSVTPPYHLWFFSMFPLSHLLDNYYASVRAWPSLPKIPRDEAPKFFGSASRFYMTGDCEKVANLQMGNRSAMGKVSQL